MSGKPIPLLDARALRTALRAFSVLFACRRAARTLTLPTHGRIRRRNGDVHQYICAAENYKPDKLIDCQISKEFSELYGKPVLICKRKDPY